jgi:hypothetical protein
MYTYSEDLRFQVFKDWANVLDEVLVTNTQAFITTVLDPVLDPWFIKQLWIKQHSFETHKFHIYILLHLRHPNGQAYAIEGLLEHQNLANTNYEQASEKLLQGLLNYTKGYLYGKEEVLPADWQDFTNGSHTIALKGEMWDYTLEEQLDHLVRQNII